MNTINYIHQKIESAKDLDFGTIFNESIELFKKVWVQGLVTLLATMALMIPFYIIMYIPMIAMGIYDPEAFQQGSEPSMAVLIPMYIFMFIISFVAAIIGFGMKAAFFRICKNKDLGNDATDDYFYFFKKPYIGKMLKLAAITFGISLAAVMLCVLPIFYVIVPISLMNVIFAFNPELSASDITNASFKLGNKKWLLIFGLIIISSLLAQVVGMIMCFIGIFVTASFSYIPLYFVYKKVIGFDDQDDIARLGEATE